MSTDLQANITSALTAVNAFGSKKGSISKRDLAIMTPNETLSEDDKYAFLQLYQSSQEYKYYVDTLIKYFNETDINGKSHILQQVPGIMAFQDIRNANLNHSLQAVIKEGNEKDKIIAAQNIKINVLENQLKKSVTGEQIDKIANIFKQLTDNYRQSLIKTNSDTDNTMNQSVTNSNT